MTDAQLPHRGELWRWSVRGAGLAVGVLVVLVTALVLRSAMDVIVLMIVSILLAAALEPVVDGIRSRAGISRVKVILGVYVALILLTTLLVILFVPAAVGQLSHLSTQLPDLIADGRAWAADLEPAIVGTTLEGLIGTLEATFMRSGVTGPDPETVVEVGLTAADAVITVITVITLVFFWLISRETMQRFALSLLRLDHRASVRSAWDEIEGRMGYWLRGQLTLMTIVGVMTTIAYLVLGLENALLLGLFAGVAEIIPIVGPAIGAIPALISAFIGGGPELALLVAGVYVVIQVVEGQVLVPMVMKNVVGLPPFVVIISLLVGGSVAGLVGALLAVPVAAALAVVLEYAQARREPVPLETPDFADEPEGEPDPDPGTAASSRARNAP